MENVLVGMQGWLHDKWQGNFYPEDLPADWQLDFYSNQFYCVLIEQEQWLNWTEEQLTEIAESLEGEDFYITLKVATGGGGKILQIQDKLGSLLHGVLLENTTEIDVYKPLKLAITLKSAQESLEDSWQFKSAGYFYSGFPLAELDLSAKSIVEQKDWLISFQQSLNKQQVAGFVYITNIGNSEFTVKEVIDLQVLAELLWL